MSLKTVPSAKDKEDDMKANTAATKIQAGFRGYRVRKQLKEVRDQGSPRESDSEASSPPPLKRQDTSSRINLEEKSATKIQAGVRGFLVRKRQQVATAAATRIQAGFRGFRTRKQLKQTEHIIQRKFRGGMREGGIVRYGIDTVSGFRQHHGSCQAWRSELLSNRYNQQLNHRTAVVIETNSTLS